MYQTIMNVEISNLLLTVAGSLLMALGAALFWVIQRFTDSVSQLSATVVDMRTVMSAIEERILGIRKDVDKADSSMSQRIQDIEEEIYKIDKELYTLKGEMNTLKVLEEEHHSKI